uniref:Secreted peptide n=1 Tax=Anopheles braziliensis TaxID=58242 RepID=A0A2M3ZLE7_9DIPT
MGDYRLILSLYLSLSLSLSLTDHGTPASHGTWWACYNTLAVCKTTLRPAGACVRGSVCSDKIERRPFDNFLPITALQPLQWNDIILNTK